VNYKANFNDFKINLMITTPILIIMYFSTKNIFLSFGLFTLILLIITIWTILSNHLGYKRHRKIIESDGFRKLLLKGFKIKKLNEYIGLNGIYKGYLFDIYYDWNAVTNNSKNSRAVILNIYFETPKLSNNETDHNSLRRMSEKYKNSYLTLSPKNHLFCWREGNILMNNTVGLRNPNHEFIIQRMDILVELMVTEKLEPIDKETIDEIRRENKFACIPEIEIYYKNIC